MLSRARLVPFALTPALVLAALVPAASVPREAEACGKGGAPAARHRFGAVVENESASPTDLVIIRSPVEALKSSTPLTATEGHLERADGTVIPVKVSQLGEMPDASLAEVRSALIPESPLAPNTAYVAVIGNLAKHETPDGKNAVLVTKPLRLAFTTGAGPRVLAKPLVIEEGAAKEVKPVASARKVCCKTTACGLTYDTCVPRDEQTRELRDLRLFPSNSPDAIVSVRVTTDRAFDETNDEVGWTSAPGARTLVKYGYGSVESLVLPLVAGEHACVVAVATDLFTGIEIASEPFCVDGPASLPAPVVACANIASLAGSNQCDEASAELDELALSCGLPSPLHPPSGGGTGGGNTGGGASSGLAGTGGGGGTAGASGSAAGGIGGAAGFGGVGTAGSGGTAGQNSAPVWDGKTEGDDIADKGCSTANAPSKSGCLCAFGLGLAAAGIVHRGRRRPSRRRPSGLVHFRS